MNSTIHEARDMESNTEAGNERCVLKDQITSDIITALKCDFLNTFTPGKLFSFSHAHACWLVRRSLIFLCFRCGSMVRSEDALLLNTSRGSISSLQQSFKPIILHGSMNKTDGLRYAKLTSMSEAFEKGGKVAVSHKQNHLTHRFVQRSSRCKS